MVTKIIARDFRGLSFDQEIDQFTLFSGPNGSGKSSRTNALILAVMGYLPSDQAKRAMDIYATHASGPEMVVAFETDSGQRFSRKYKISPEGNGLQIIGLNGKAVNQKQIERVLIDLGNPMVFDLRSFNDLSEQRKIEFLLELSPPSKELHKIEQDLAEAEEKINDLRGKTRAKKGIIEQLSGERSALKLPAGTLAEIQAEIKAKTADLDKAQEDLKAEELAEQKRKDEEAAKERERIAKERAEEKAKKDKAALEAKVLREKEEAKAKAKREADAILAREAEAKQREEEARQSEAEALQRAEAAQKDLEDLGVEIGRREKEFDATLKELAAQGPRATCAGSLKKVQQVLLDSGCQYCSALIILNLEIQKYEEDGEPLEA